MSVQIKKTINRNKKTRMNKPDTDYCRISIVLPSYNQDKYIERTILSVIDQNYPNTELIIIDGQSTDESYNIACKYKEYFTTMISEKDNGQSSAINKGFRLATGDFITWLNTDDLLLPGSLHQVNMYAKKYPNATWFAGNFAWIDKDDAILRLRKGEPWNGYFARQGFFSVYGPSTFLKKELLEKHGYLREDFHYMMDTELWARLIFGGESFVRLKNYCWALRLHEEAKMSGHNFSNSQYSDIHHPSWVQKRKEEEFIDTQYFSLNRKKYNKPLFLLYKLISANISDRLLSNLRYKMKHINTLYI